MTDNYILDGRIPVPCDDLMAWANWNFSPENNEQHRRVAQTTEDEVRFEFTDGSAALLYHEQDCCESVALYDIAGNLDDLIGVPLLKAEESSNSDDPPEMAWGPPESFTWTFYLLATIKGYVTLRWLGESNGYYSESVDFREVSSPAPAAGEGDAQP